MKAQTKGLIWGLIFGFLALMGWQRYQARSA